MPYTSAIDQFKSSSAVFSGVVKDVLNSTDNDLKYLVIFNMTNNWKGNLSQNVTLTTCYNSACCGYNFTKGKEYLVYAYGTNESLSTYICTTSRI